MSNIEEKREDLKINKWLQSGKHLPKCIRDFHDQKNLFKSIFERMEPNKEYFLKELDYINTHTFVIDYFLYFMGRRGYTLQKNRTKLNFSDLSNDLEEYGKERKNRELKVLQGILKK